jgi:CBS domain containing-hemolysin-like protein
MTAIDSLLLAGLIAAALAVASTAALIAMAEATLLSPTRTANDPQAPPFVQSARAFPRLAVVSLWLCRDLVLIGAVALGLAVADGNVGFASGLVAVALVSSFLARGFVARIPQPMRGPVWRVVANLAPISRLGMAAARLVSHRLGKRSLDGFIQGDHEQPDPGEESVLEPEEQELLVKVRAFGSRQVREVMTPRVDIFSLPEETAPRELLAKVDEARFARVPIYRGEKDNVVGILYVKDLIGRSIDDGFDLASVLHRPTVVPPGKPVDEVFRELRKSKVHLALVIDELGSLVGLVTMEDLLEELFGEIRDESDSGEPRIERHGDALVVPGRLPLAELSTAIGRPVPASANETTVSGLLMETAGRIPRVADQITAAGLRFTVERREGTVLRRIRVEPMP